MTDPIEEAREQMLDCLSSICSHSARSSCASEFEAAIRQQERSRYEGVLVEAVARVGGLTARLGAAADPEDRAILDRLIEQTKTALTDPAPIPSTEDVCAECDGTKQVRAGGRVYPGAGAAYRMKPCPSCTKTGETK